MSDREQRRERLTELTDPSASLGDQMRLATGPPGEVQALAAVRFARHVLERRRDEDPTIHVQILSDERKLVLTTLITLEMALTTAVLDEADELDTCRCPHCQASNAMNN